MSDQRYPHVLSIAGSDSGGGAGIQADLKTFSALRTFGATVVTAVTAQNTVEVAAIAEVPEEVVIAQIDTVIEDIGVSAIKTGMLSSRRIIVNVADRLEAWGVPYLVVDPVMISKSGVPLLSADAIDTLRDELLPLATIVTPNIHEAEILADHKITGNNDVERAARVIHAQGPDLVVIKGGHLEGSPVDVVFDGARFHRLEAQRIDTSNTHGTGCTYSAAITAFLAHGLEPLESIQLAKLFVTNALKHSFSIGAGHSPVHHFAPLPDAILERLAAPTP